MQKVKGVINGPENLAVIPGPLNIEASDFGSQNKRILNLNRIFFSTCLER